jgi:hypothetical protein
MAHDKLVGFRVSGARPGASFFNPPRESDDFGLHQVAIEHAHRLHGRGWRDVALHMVLRDDDGCERLEPMTLHLETA